MSISDIYRNQLGREPDAKGLAHYRGQLAGGRSLESIRQEIRNSPEAQTRGVGAYANGGSGGSSQNNEATQPAEPKYNLVIGDRGVVNFDGLPRGRGFHSLYDSLRTASKSRPDLFQGRIRDRDLSIKEGYSFVGGEGKVLVDSINYKGNDTNPGGTLNIYRDAAAMETGNGGEGGSGGSGGSGGGGGGGSGGGYGY